VGTGGSVDVGGGGVDEGTSGGGVEVGWGTSEVGSGGGLATVNGPGF